MKFDLYSSMSLVLLDLEQGIYSNPTLQNILTADGKRVKEWVWRVDFRFGCFLVKRLQQALAGQYKADPPHYSPELPTTLDKRFWPILSHTQGHAADFIFSHLSLTEGKDVFAKCQSSAATVTIEPPPLHYFDPAVWSWMGLPHEFKTVNGVGALVVPPWHSYEKDRKRFVPSSSVPKSSIPDGKGKGARGKTPAKVGTSSRQQSFTPSAEE